MSGAEDRISRIDGLRRQAKRCSALSDLVGEQPGAGAFAGLAAGIQAEIENLTNLQAEVYNHRLRTEVLIAEMSTLTARLKLLSNEVSFNQRSRFAAEDVREESRLCLEEAKATEEAAAKRLLAWQATTLAQIADRMSQGKRSDGD